MPYINLKTNKTVSADKCELLKKGFGKAIECFDGKTEAWLMVSIESEAQLWFRGDNSGDIAIVDVDLLGQVNGANSEAMTVEVCKLLSEVLDISSDMVYVKYSGYKDWGWNNSNF